MDDDTTIENTLFDGNLGGKEDKKKRMENSTSGTFFLLLRNP